MFIQNYATLAKNAKTKHALDIIEAGLQASQPEVFLKKFVTKTNIKTSKIILDLKKFSKIHIVSYGKAADSMAKTIDSIVGVGGGIVVIPSGSKSLVSSKKFRVISSGHPLPNKKSVTAAKAILKYLKQRKKDELVIFLVSGGGSALLSLPDGITLEQKIQTSKALLQSGASIDEFNCVRKHLSRIKGGYMVAALSCNAVALVMSDVKGNDLSSISSGCTYCDKTTFADALKIIGKYKLQKKLPKKIINHLTQGLYGKISETPKKSVIVNQIIATNQDCLEAMAKKAKKLGYFTQKVSCFGDIKSVSKRLSKKIPKKPHSCVIFGGETTVRVTGKGKGGRNQELILHLLKQNQKAKHDLIFCSIGTDGIDGNTKHAGAITTVFKIDPNVIDRSIAKNDSNSFFAKYGGLIKTGYTHTNLMDVGLILR